MRHKQKIALALGLLISLTQGVRAEYVNPCQGKHWLDQPVNALAAIESTGNSGIGGTGHQLPVIPSHLLSAHGGEGDGIGGTGIIGVIAGFGSICVAGQEIHYDHRTPVFVDGKPAVHNAFGLGQMVSARVRETSEGFVAVEILVLHEVRGPVEAVSREQRAFRILGQNIEFSGELPDSVQAGQQLAVSGFRLPDGRIKATRVERSTEQLVSLVGSVVSTAESSFVLSGQQVRLLAPGPVPVMGSEVQVEGVMRGQVLEGARWVANPRLAYSAPVERVFLQGHVRQIQEGIANLDGVAIRLRDSTEKVKTGDRIEAVIELGGAGRMEAEKWSVEPREPKMMLPRPDFQGGGDAPPRNLNSPTLPPLRPVLRPEIPRGNSRVDITRPERIVPPTGLDRPRPTLPMLPGANR